jgi:hypothetical protein
MKKAYKLINPLLLSRNITTCQTQKKENRIPQAVQKSDKTVMSLTSTEKIKTNKNIVIIIISKLVGKKEKELCNK